MTDHETAKTATFKGDPTADGLTRINEMEFEALVADEDVGVRMVKCTSHWVKVDFIHNGERIGRAVFHHDNTPAKYFKEASG